MMSIQAHCSTVVHHNEALQFLGSALDVSTRTGVEIQGIVSHFELTLGLLLSVLDVVKEFHHLENNVLLNLLEALGIDIVLTSEKFPCLHIVDFVSTTFDQQQS